MLHNSHGQLRVAIFRNGELVSKETFGARHVIVGRDPTLADLVIGSGQVSREHALLEHDGHRVYVHDLGSTNGIYVNGRRVERAELTPWDRLRLGEHLLRLELLTSRATAEVAPVVSGETTGFFSEAEPMAEALPPPRPRMTLRLDATDSIIQDDAAEAEAEAEAAPLDAAPG